MSTSRPRTEREVYKGPIFQPFVSVSVEEVAMLTIDRKRILYVAHVMQYSRVHCATKSHPKTSSASGSRILVSASYALSLCSDSKSMVYLLVKSQLSNI
jgi:hypothetical protein